MSYGSSVLPRLKKGGFDLGVMSGGVVRTPRTTPLPGVKLLQEAKVSLG